MIRNLTGFPNNVISNNYNNNNHRTIFTSIVHNENKCCVGQPCFFKLWKCSHGIKTIIQPQTALQRTEKKNSYRHATTRANMHPFRNLTLYLSIKVTFTAVFTLDFTQWSSQFLNKFFSSELINSLGALLPVYSSSVDRLQISQWHCCPSYTNEHMI